jgi:two-component system LytT family response regulator
MTKAIVIEPQSQWLSQLSSMLRQYCRDSLQVAGTYTSVEDAITEIRKHAPGYVFIDAGLHAQAERLLAQQLQSQEWAYVFSGDSESYAYHAFQHNAIDYLLKPFETAGLQRLALKIKTQKPAEPLSRKLDGLMGNIEQLKQYSPLRKIMVPTASGFELLPLIDIVRCESAINYTHIYLKNRPKLVVARTLKEFENQLTDQNFFRIHNSHLVNLAYVRSYNKGKGGSILLMDGTELEVSTRRRDDFLQKMASL